MEVKIYRKLEGPRSKIKLKFLNNMDIKARIQAWVNKTDNQLQELNKNCGGLAIRKNIRNQIFGTDHQVKIGPAGSLPSGK